MQRGIHKTKRPSGYQQRRAKIKKNESLSKLRGSILQYVKRPDEAQGSSKDTVLQPLIDEANLSAASMHLAEEDVEIEENKAEEQEKEMDEFVAEEWTDSDSNHDTENVMMKELKEKNLNILNDASYWNVPIPDHSRLLIIKRGSASLQNKDGPFKIVTRQDKKAKEDVRQLSKEWFYKVMPNGEKVLRTWMVYSPVSEKLYCFCCRLFSANATDATSKFVIGFQK